MLASSSTTRILARRRGGRPAGEGSPAAERVPRGRWLSSQASMSRLPEAPLAADADRGNLARLDQPVDRTQVDLEVLQHLFGREKGFVDHVKPGLSS